MSSTPRFLADPRAEQLQLVPAFSTRPRILWTPGENGSRIHAINIAGNDAGANKVQLAIARALTLSANMGSGAFVDGGGSSDTITRSAGSFVTDGWKVGDRIVPNGATTVANDFEAILTAVAALTLTFATATVDTAEAFASGTKLFKLLKLGYVDVAAGSGLPSVVAVSGLSTTQMPMLDASPDRYIELGPDDYLFANVNTALGTGEIVDVVAFGADY